MCIHLTPKVVPNIFLIDEFQFKELNNTLFSILFQATGGGRMRWGHFEMVRNGISRKLDMKRMFAIWRIDSPWQSVTKKVSLIFWFI